MIKKLFYVCFLCVIMPTLRQLSLLAFNEFKTFCKSGIGRYGIIYSFKSPSGKMYIGQTTSDRFSKRMSHHKTRDGCRAFHRAIKKYGWDTIKKGFKILAFTRNISSLDALEIKFIKQYDSFKNGYNLTEGGGGIRGLKHSLKTRKKQSEATKNHYKDPEARKKLSEAGKKSYRDNPERLRKHREMLKAFHASEAGQQQRKRAREKATAANRKPIIATNLQTGETTQYVSVADAARKLSALYKRKFDFSNISMCARKKQKTHKGHTFEFAFKSSA